MGGAMKRSGTRPAMTVADLEAFLAEAFPQAAPMRLAIEHVDARTIRLAMPTGEEHLRPGGTVAGPTLMALADCAIYLLILAQTGPKALTVTTNFGINFLRKPEPGRLVAEGRLLKLGKRLAVGDVLLFTPPAEEPVAHATVTYSIPPVGDRGR
jgi:uncharacterized protein (TIGR00369 family)